MSLNQIRTLAPIRSYTKTSNQIKDFDPATQAIIAYCQECRHNATLNLDRLEPDLTIPDLRRRLRCAECGVREAEIRIGYIAAGGYRYS